MKTAILFVLMFWAASAWGQDYDSAIRQGNVAYNAGEYPAAQGHYVKAIQTEPMRAIGYRNLARAYFWTDQYGAAAHYYEHYLKLAPAEAEDLEQIAGERKLAVARAGEDIFRLPENVRLARQALESELESGRAYTESGGGAWGLYETLLRTGYAEPDLIQVRATLSRRLMDEFDGLLLPAAQDFLPVASFEAWQVQSQRLVALRRIQRDPATLELINRRSTVVECALAMLSGQIDQSVDLARLARTSNPDLRFLTWYEVVALTRANRHEEALTTLEQFSRQLRTENPAHISYAMALRALILKRQERTKDAAEVLKTFLFQSVQSDG